MDRVLGKRLTLGLSRTCEQSPTVCKTATNIIGEKTEKGNCSEQRLNDVSADRIAVVRQQLRLL